MKIERRLGRGYYTLERLGQQRSRVQQRLERLDLLIDRAGKLQVAQKKMRLLRNDRDKRIVKLRKQGLTLEEIGDRFGLTKNRVGQILEWKT